MTTTGVWRENTIGRVRAVNIICAAQCVFSHKESEQWSRITTKAKAGHAVQRLWLSAIGNYGTVRVRAA